MTAKLIDGKALAQSVRAELASRLPELNRRLGRPPGLGVVLVGDDPGSAIYVRNKEKAAASIGLLSEVVRLDAAVSLAAVLAEVDRMNARRDIDAFIVQLPLPPHIDSGQVLGRIAPAKDADGLHPENLGRLAAGLAAPRPCTPAGVMAMLDSIGFDLRGKHAVVVGRSNIVGKPVALMLLERHATVTWCHSRTLDLGAEVKRGDVVVAAVGRPRLIQGAWLKEGAVVIDVGVNRVDGELMGDVDFASASERAAWISPVPGGVGPMTIAMLMKNAVDAAARSLA